MDMPGLLHLLIVLSVLALLFTGGRNLWPRN